MVCYQLGTDNDYIDFHWLVTKGSHSYYESKILKLKIAVLNLSRLINKIVKCEWYLSLFIGETMLHVIFTCAWHVYHIRYRKLCFHGFLTFQCFHNVEACKQVYLLLYTPFSQQLTFLEYIRGLSLSICRH